MPRLHKDLPAERSAWSFGDLVYWHLFVHGTRPSINPSAGAGREWDAGAICHLLGITDRTLRNWIADRNFPDSSATLAEELFGDNPAHNPARLELGAALRRSRARRKLKKGFFGALIGFAQVVKDQTDDHDDQVSENDTGESRNVLPALRPRAPGPKEPRRITTLIASRLAGTSRGAPLSEWHSFRSDGTQGRSRRISAAHILVPGLALGIGFAVWASRSPKIEPASKTQVATVIDTPESHSTPAQVSPMRPPSPMPNLSPVPLPSPPPVATTEAPKSAPPKTRPTPEIKPDAAQTETGRKAAEAERIARLAFAANQAAYDKKMRDEETAARRRDQDGDAEKELQAARAWNARQVAGIGYDLTENTSISGTSGGLVYVENVVDCALKCSEIGCDAFAFSSLGTNRHGCYRYRGPVTLVPHEAYSVGKRMAPTAAPVREEANNGSVATDAPLPTGGMTAQAAPTTPTDDLTRCANGPFKVSGFKLLCDKLIAGGSSPGSYRERYVVTTINQCAAYCRQASHCSGFTYHAAQRGNQHDCQILGAGFITNDGAGWLSGVR